LTARPDSKSASIKQGEGVRPGVFSGVFVGKAVLTGVLVAVGGAGVLVEVGPAGVKVEVGVMGVTAWVVEGCGVGVVETAPAAWTQSSSTEIVTAPAGTDSVCQTNEVIWVRAWAKEGGLGMEPQFSRDKDPTGTVTYCHVPGWLTLKLNP